MPKVSVCIPVYNQTKHLRRCLDSTLAQSWQDMEVLLLDDGSNDGSELICDEYANADPRVKVMHTDNRSIAAARNTLLDAATGEYITWLDSDDCMHPSFIDTLLNSCLEHNCDIAQCRYREFSSPQPRFQTSPRPAIRLFDNHNIFSSTRYTSTVWGKLYKACVWDGVRMSEGRLHEDDEASWQTYYRAAKIAFIDSELYGYYKNPEGIMANMASQPSHDFIDTFRERIAFFKNQGENLLVRASQWRYCMSLMLTYSHECDAGRRKLLVSEFMDNRNGALSAMCPLYHKAIIAAFGLCPPFASALIKIVRHK